MTLSREDMREYQRRRREKEKQSPAEDVLDRFRRRLNQANPVYQSQIHGERFLHYLLSIVGDCYAVEDENDYHEAFFRSLVGAHCLSEKIGSILKIPLTGSYFILLKPSQNLIEFLPPSSNSYGVGYFCFARYCEEARPPWRTANVSFIIPRLDTFFISRSDTFKRWLRSYSKRLQGLGLVTSREELFSSGIWEKLRLEEYFKKDLEQRGIFFFKGPSRQL